ncbi:cytochrome c oxidase assembly protein [Actinacidiphila oryziradicis]|uniref:cytochrome c oxidase assembly protein n=1 Tax=Actinacidiphila oryziradicis TaxID=2571141 RepID=UPI0023F3B26B|nr:cytochrome c oxidase assembly protein [Actinacidiphila oryziradicis]MCW2870053.1 putative copper resistance protein [Actinacidiphila oryziradicis]
MNMTMEMPAPLGWHTLLTTWRPVLGWDLAVLVALAAYLYAVHRAGEWPLHRTAVFCMGLVVLEVSVSSAIGVYAHPLFWMHMVQHLLLIMVVPILLVAGQPLRLTVSAFGDRADRLLRSRAAGWLFSVPIGFGVYAVTIAGTHLTPFMQLMLTHGYVHVLEQVLYLVSGFLLFLPLIAHEPVRWPLAYPLRLGVLAMAMAVDTFVGVILMMTVREPFPGYVAMHQSWQPSPIQDLHGGGAIMWAGGDSLMLILMFAVALEWMTDHARRDSLGGWLESVRANALAGIGGDTGPDGAPLRRSADVDKDPGALDAYNAMLAKLSEHPE